jgi:hypothetical protein
MVKIAGNAYRSSVTGWFEAVKHALGGAALDGLAAFGNVSELSIGRQPVGLLRFGRGARCDNDCFEDIEGLQVNQASRGRIGSNSEGLPGRHRL